MLSNIRKHLTPSTGIALIALVFALTGGAFAATGGSPGNTTKGGSSGTSNQTQALISKAKAKTKSKTGPRGPAGPKGATGPAGPAGPAGAAGAKGENGTAGTNGTDGTNGVNGTNGESVTFKAVATGNGSKCAGLGGGEYTVGVKTTLVCNGQTGFTETLPSGKTETGSWSATGAGVATVISFPIPLSAGLDGNHVHIATPGTASECPGSLEKPAAAPGNLCVYETETERLASAIFLIADPSKEAFPTSGAGTSGALLVTSFTNSELVYGTFAVTAAE